MSYKIYREQKEGPYRNMVGTVSSHYLKVTENAYIFYSGSTLDMPDVTYPIAGYIVERDK